MKIGKEVRIQKVCFSQMLDATGNDAIQITVISEEGNCQKAILPIEKDVNHLLFHMQNIEQEIDGISVFNQSVIDRKLIDFQNTFPELMGQKTVLLGISIACCKVAANELHIPLYTYLGGISGGHIPSPMIQFSENLWVIPCHVPLFSKRIQMCAKIGESLRNVESQTVTKETILDVCNQLNLSPDFMTIGNLEKIFDKGDFIWIDGQEFCSVTEIFHQIRSAKAEGKTPILKRGKRETEETFLADLAVALNLKYVSFGKTFGAENATKYNRMIEIEEYLM